MRKTLVLVAIMLGWLAVLVFNDTLDPDPYLTHESPDLYLTLAPPPPRPFEVTGPLEVEWNDIFPPGTLRLSLPIRWLSTGSYAPEGIRVTVVCDGSPNEMHLRNREQLRYGQEVVLTDSFGCPGPVAAGSCRAIRAVTRTLGLSGGDDVHSWGLSFSAGEWLYGYGRSWER